MTPCEYTALDGSRRALDLDAVVDVIAGVNQRRAGWSGLVVFEPKSGRFVELGDGPQDYRGNAESEAKEVDECYLQETFNLAAAQVVAIRSDPKRWRFIDHRQGGSNAA